MDDTHKMKLTNAQRRLLKNICYLPQFVAPHYMPAKQLVSKGLATWDNSNGLRCVPTPAGRKENELQ